MNYRCLASEFRVLDCEMCRSGLGTSEEIEMERNRMWLILGRESVAEVRGCHLEEDGCNKASMWN
jgi:hypothetical protein